MIGCVDEYCYASCNHFIARPWKTHETEPFVGTVSIDHFPHPIPTPRFGFMDNIVMINVGMLLGATSFYE
jgi:hypothetical protein